MIGGASCMPIGLERSSQLGPQALPFMLIFTDFVVRPFSFRVGLEQFRERHTTMATFGFEKLSVTS
jgi:hypothetical protein